MAGRHFAAQPKDHRIGWKVALVLWILFIWGHSLIDGPTSAGESLAFVDLVRPLLDLLGVTDLDLVHTLVRKGAHFTEYLVLGVLASKALRPRDLGRPGLTLPIACLWVAVPCIDEFIQLHVPERVGALTDVLIDMAGFVVGLFVLP